MADVTDSVSLTSHPYSSLTVSRPQPTPFILTTNTTYNVPQLVLNVTVSQ